MKKNTFFAQAECLYLSGQNDIALKNTENEIFTALKEMLVSKGRNLVIIPHENPDGDALGSAFGLGELLTVAGHHVTIISPNDYPGFLQWIPTSAEVLIYGRRKKKAQKVLDSADLIFCVDFNEAKRAGYLEKQLLNAGCPRIMIDHHPDPVPFCDLVISEPGYSSTAGLIYDVAVRTGLAEGMNKNAATALYTGILTDTGSFSYSTSAPDTFRVASELIRYGIETDRIQAAVYNNFSADRMKLLGYCLVEKMEIFPEYRAAMITLTREELNRFNFQPGDTEGFVNYPLSVSNIVFSALFMEKEDMVKASFRSRGDFPVNRFSREHFNGGGHMNAAGGEMKMTMEETISAFRQLLPRYKHLLLETNI